MTADNPFAERHHGSQLGIVQRMSMGPGWHIEYGETRYAQIFPPRQGRPTWLAITTLHRPDGGSASPPRRREGRRLADVLTLFSNPLAADFLRTINRDLTSGDD